MALKRKKPDTCQVGVRVPVDLLGRIDAYAARQGTELGIKITRTAAVLMLLQRAFRANHDKGP